MRVIYGPRGRAKEYAELACNLYQGCDHGCLYCYAPGVRRMKMEQWLDDNPQPRAGILEKLERDADYMAQTDILFDGPSRPFDNREVLFCFMSDPYHGGDTITTRKALEIMGSRGLRATVLTKGGTRARRDFDLMKRYGFKFGSTICFMSEDARKEWEPNAPSIDDRIEAVWQAHERWGIYTWVSLEPVIDPAEALEVISACAHYVDFWKIGKINHNKELEDKVDWRKFLADVTSLLNRFGDNYYIKKDLRQFGDGNTPNHSGR